jgi:hypothetical protein
MMSHNRLNPTFAPTTVVAISSPLPTIELARIIPGPRAPIVFQKVFGGGEYPILSPGTFMPSVSLTPVSLTPVSLTPDLFSRYIQMNQSFTSMIIRKNTYYVSS